MSLTKPLPERGCELIPKSTLGGCASSIPSFGGDVFVDKDEGPFIWCVKVVFFFEMGMACYDLLAS